ncbi:hypothetical protein FACS189499_09310 [Clostridia bacterium]|nr:hypothetical protein FACS189499_09310 [Clostridia bacterium]
MLFSMCVTTSAAADKIDLNTIITKTPTNDFRDNVYRFEVTKEQKITVNLRHNFDRLYFSIGTSESSVRSVNIADKNNDDFGLGNVAMSSKTLLSGQWDRTAKGLVYALEMDSNTKTGEGNFVYHLKKGTYYLSFGVGSAKFYGTDKIKLSLTTPDNSTKLVTGKDAESVVFSLGLKKGATLQLDSAITPSSSTAEVTYTSSDKSIAKVDSNGKVTGVAKGTATITAKAGKAGNITAKIKINVS